ncbi:carbohydrate ABC transporter permease [Microbacterium sp. PAMC22086]|uniref:carbohydrate ABC transporter permease n=1 Tax=Microbacterium sp. PAMC22086 TaxID=2861281 RepID=UPI001C631AF9|nr:sugar ABC transporter permease [Microbacterium sp. PAMC22086]QYG13158.1 sugar ABC transporter permease [Microbacterium sp. PAMC22086]
MATASLIVKTKPSTTQKRQRRTYMLMLAPALLLVIGIMVPFAQGIVKSFTNEKGYIQNPTFVGLDNYISLFTNSTFLTGLGITVLYVVLVLAIQLPLALAIALLLEKTSFWRRIGRNFIVLPLLIPPIVAGLMWKTMMQPSAGVLNYLLASVGLPTSPWLTDPATSLLSVVLIDTWAFTSFSALIILAGLQALPESLREAAMIDGAGWWQSFRHIALPWLAPYIVLVALFRVADSLKQFDLIWPVTRGGPLNSTRLLHVQGYEEAFRFSSPAMAMAIIFILWIIIYLSSFLLLRLWRRTINAVE